MISLGSQGKGGIAHMTGELQRLATGSVGRTGWDSKEGKEQWEYRALPMDG